MRSRGEGDGERAEESQTKARYACLFFFSSYPSSRCPLPSKERRPAGEETFLANPRTA